MTYTLITANRNYSSWSLRPWVLMRALDIPFIDRIEPFTATDNHAAFRAFSPTGLVPALIHDQRTVYDSLGITLYLGDRHPCLWPASEESRAYAQCAVAEMHAGFAALRNECGMNVGVRARLRAPTASLQRDVERLRALWSEGLSRFGGPWLGGERFTAVDAFFSPVAFRVRTYGLDVGAIGQAWVERVLAHPAMQEWEQQALRETWREPAHEAELLAMSSVVQDHRQ